MYTPVPTKTAFLALKGLQENTSNETIYKLPVVVSAFYLK
jgi:hypothetical protein